MGMPLFCGRYMCLSIDNSLAIEIIISYTIRKKNIVIKLKICIGIGGIVYEMFLGIFKSST